MDYRPRIVSWNVTSACNLRCPHCYLDAGRRGAGELSTQEGFRLIGQMAELGTELLILTGGEPLLRRDLPALASHASGEGIHVVLGTSGTLMTPQKAQVLKQSGVAAAGISLDSVVPAKHDAFRGVPGAWRRAVAGIEACRLAGMEVLVHVTALQMNEEEIPALLQLAHERGARAFNLFFLVCSGRGERLTDLSPQAYERLLSFILEAQDRYPGMMVRARCAPYLGRLAAERGTSVLWGAGCLAGTRYCRISPGGDLTPCPYLPVVAGNVRNQSLREVWEEAPVLQRLRQPRLGGKCGVCVYSRGEDPICVGCRARSYALAGDLLAEDPWCLYEPAAAPAAPAAMGAATSAAEDGSAPAPLAWSDEARQRIERVPFFIRGRVRQAAEGYARQQGLDCVTPEVLEHLRRAAYGRERS